MNRLLRTAALGTVLACSAGASAQNQVPTSYYVDRKLVVTAPAALFGPRKYTLNDGTDWGGLPNQNYINVPLKRVALPDSLNCNAPSSSTLYTGTFAIFYRGDCEFGAKALNAQNGGAQGAIIINNIPGDPIAMGAGAVGAQVTIPLVMVSQTDGAAIMNRIRAGQTVTISFSRWGLNLASDVGIVESSPVLPPFQVAPLSQMTSSGNPRAYKFYNGAYVANYSTAGGDQTNVKLRAASYFTPTGSSTATLVRRDSFNRASFAQADSLDLGTYLDTTGFFYTPPGTGRYNTYYSLNADAADGYTRDNTDSSVVMYVTDSIMSKSAWDPIAMRPMNNGGYRFTSNDLTFGHLYYVTKGGYAFRQLQFTVGSDSNNTMQFNGAVASGRVWKWVDGANGNVRDNIIQAPELTLVAIGSKNFLPTDPVYANSFMTLSSPSSKLLPRTEANAWYFVGLSVTGDGSRLGVDGGLTNYFSRGDVTANGDSTRTEFWAPYSFTVADNIDGNFTGAINMFPFYETADIYNGVQGFVNTRGAIPALAVHLSKDVPTSVQTVDNPISEFNVFPNPATTELAMNFKASVAVKDPIVSIVNGLGQQVAEHHLNATGTTTVSIRQLAPGMYYVILAGADHAVSQKITVLAH